jgi:hypothetical protein
MTAHRTRARKPPARRTRFRQVVKRRQDVAAFEAWQRQGRVGPPAAELRRPG